MNVFWFIRLLYYWLNSSTAYILPAFVSCLSYYTTFVISAVCGAQYGKLLKDLQAPWKNWLWSSFYFEIKRSKQNYGPLGTGSAISPPAFLILSTLLTSSEEFHGFIFFFMVRMTIRLFTLLISLFQSFQWLLNGHTRVFWTLPASTLFYVC